jgi:hypothetical protein
MVADIKAQFENKYYQTTPSKIFLYNKYFSGHNCIRSLQRLNLPQTSEKKIGDKRSLLNSK